MCSNTLSGPTWLVNVHLCECTSTAALIFCRAMIVLYTATPSPSLKIHLLKYESLSCFQPSDVLCVTRMHTRQARCLLEACMHGFKLVTCQYRFLFCFCFFLSFLLFEHILFRHTHQIVNCIVYDIVFGVLWIVSRRGSSRAIAF